jgi:predicted TIM-barrel fold metal-dependent hydrolase
LSGVFDRFPKLQIYWAENNIGWIPYFYQQMDQAYKVNCSWAEPMLGLKRLSRLPSEYLQEHAHWGFWDDPIGMEVRRYIGVDRIMWSTDFPHIVSRWPESRKLVDEQFVGVPEQERHAILAGNAVKFFHLDGN